MAKLILLSGADEVVKWSLETSKKLLPPFIFLDFAFDPKPKNFSELVEFRDKAEGKVIKAVRPRLKRDVNVILAIDPFLKTDIATIPLLTERFFRNLKPDLLVRMGEERGEAGFALAHGIAFRQIMLKKGAAKKALKELLDLLKVALC